jgi:hypothetical protein
MINQLKISIENIKLKRILEKGIKAYRKNLIGLKKR